jgi:hypothetical protein
MALREMYAYTDKANVDRLVALTALIAFVKVQQSYRSPRVVMQVDDGNLDKSKKMTKLDIQGTFPQLKGSVGIFKIYDDFKNHIKYYRENRVTIMKKIEENQKLMKYRFIK